MKTAFKLALSTVLVAGAVAPAQADVWQGVAVSGTATYTEASNNGLSMGDLQTAAGTEGGRRAFFIEPEHEFDYGVGLSYRVGHPNGVHDTRVFFDYDHFRDDSDRHASGLRNLGIDPSNGSGITDSQAGARHRAHQFRAGIAQTLHFGPRLDVTLNGFFDYTKLERKVAEIIRQAGGVDSRSTEDELRGYGLGVGAMARGTPMHGCPEFGVFGGMNGTLLYSDQEYVQAAYTGTGATPTLVYQYSPEDSKSIISKFDAEAGIDYRRVVNSDMARFLFQVALGVRYVNVANAFKSGNTAWNPSKLGNSVPSGYAQWTGPAFDFGRMGVFLKLTLGGADA